MALSDLATLINATAQNTSQFKGLTAAYEFLGLGVPTIDGYTVLINTNNDTNFGAGPGVTFNDENVYINTMNALYQGNATAKGVFDALVNGGAAIQDKLTIVYNTIVPVIAQTDAGRDFFISQSAFYTARAAELGIAGLNGAALVGAASLMKIVVDDDVGGFGDAINDLLAAVNNGTAVIPQSGSDFTPLETADGTQFDGDDVSPSAGQTFALTQNIDVLTGTDGADTFVGSNTTLNTGDNLNGGEGSDTLNVAFSGSNAPIATLNSIETVNISTAIASNAGKNITGGNWTGVTKLALTGLGVNLADEGWSFIGLKNNMAIELNNVSVLGVNEVVIFTQFAPGALGSTTATLELGLHGVSEDGGGAANVMVDTQGTDKITKLNVSSSSGTNVVQLEGASNDEFILTDIVVAGSGNNTLSVDGTKAKVTGLTTFDASKATGDLTADVSASNNDVTFTGGSGKNTITFGNGNNTITGGAAVDTFTLGTGNSMVNSGAGADVIDGSAGGNLTINSGDDDDRVVMGGQLDANDSLDGGNGTDTVTVNNLANIDAVDSPPLTNFEILAFTGVASGILNVNGTSANASTIPTSINTFNFEGGLGGATTLNNLQDNVTVNLLGNPNSQILTLDHENDTSTNVLNLGWTGGADQTLGTLSAPDAETINFSIDETATDRGLTINNLNAPDLNGATITITGDGNLTIGDAAAAGLTKVEASSATGDIDIAGIFGDAANDGLQDAFSGASGITINTGAGNDRIIGSNNAAQSDTISTGAGNDVVIATTGGDSITLGDGTDVIGYTALAQSSGATIDTVSNFVSGTDQFDFTQLLGGNATFIGNFASLGAAQGAVNNGGAIEAVLQQDTNTLWVDVNNDGVLNTNDLQIVVSGVTSLVQADINGNTAFPNNVLLTAPNADTTNGTNTLNNATTSAANDIISSSDTNLSGSTVNGQSGTDVLNVTDQATAGNFNTATITNTQTINLIAGSTAINTGNVAGNLVTLNANAASDVTIDNNNAGITFNGSAAADTFQIGITDFFGTLAGNGDTDVLTSTGGDISSANGGAATTFETYTQTGGDVSMTVTQHNAFTTINGGGTETITLTDVGMVTGDADIETYSLANGNNDFTVGAVDQNVTENDGVNTVKIGSQKITGTYTGFDIFDILNATGGANTVGAIGINGFGRLDLVGGITMTAVQNQAIVTGKGIVAAGATDVVTIASSNYATITTGADVETYLLGEDTSGDAITVHVNRADQNVSTASANDVIDFNLGGLTSFTGELVGGGTANDELSSTATTLNITTAMLTNIEGLDLNGTNTNITMTDGQIDAFANTVNDIVTTGTSSTLTISDNASFTVDDMGVLDRADFLNFVLQGTGTDSIVFFMEDDDAVLNTVDISAGGHDDILLGNASIEGNATSVDYVTITGFTFGVDDLDIEIGGTNVSGATSFDVVAAGSGTDITLATNGVIEIAGANSISAATATDTIDGGNVELAIVSALGTVANGDNDNYAVIIYGDGNAYVYTANFADGDAAAVTTGGLTVELVGVLDSVGLGTLSADDFI